MFGENLELEMSPSFLRKISHRVFLQKKSPSWYGVLKVTEFFTKKVTELVGTLKSHRVFYKKKSPSW